MVVLLKFVQWIMSRYNSLYSDKNKPSWYKLLDNFYENCPIHSFDYTNNTKTHFNKPTKIFDNIDIEPSSGSIAQVYRCKYNNKESVLKIVHPDLKK